VASRVLVYLSAPFDFRTSLSGSEGWFEIFDEASMIQNLGEAGIDRRFLARARMYTVM